MTATIQVDLRITSVRSRGRFGGAIVAGETVDTQSKYVVKFKHQLLADANTVNKGQVWQVAGAVSETALTLPYGHIVKEQTIDAASATLLTPSGENLIAYLADHPDIVGVGLVKATKLYQCFGLELLDIIRQRDIGRLRTVVNADSAQAIVDAFEEHNCMSALLFLDGVGLPRSIGRKVMEVYGSETQQKIQADPYRLLSFCADWKTVDQFAMEKSNIKPDAQVRLQAAIEESLYRCFDDGSTAADVKQLKHRLGRLLGITDLVHSALNQGETNGQYYRTQNLYHPAGAWLMERFIANQLRILQQGEAAEQQNLTAVSDTIETLISNYETLEGYRLTTEQRNAVINSTSNRISLITGGAGVGKTTVLKCIYAVIGATEPFGSIYQMALSGKAAKRMRESTGIDSYTIAGFLRNVAEIPDQAWIVIDEASMVDVVTFYRLLRQIPETCRLILIGDPYQLPPVGPGLVLHALVRSSIPQAMLKEVKRQSEATGIPQVAESIRQGQWPQLKRYRHEAISGVSFMHCTEDQIGSAVIDVYRELGGDGSSHDVQILCPTRSGIGGTGTLNIALQNTFKSEQPSICFTDEEFGTITYLSGCGSFKLGDLVIYTRNDYERGLRNGSLGKILQTLQAADPSEPVCIADFEGMRVELNATDLGYLELAYAITVHKSQGSQFNRVIVPLRRSRLLDLTLLYTAVTRSINQVVLIGDELVARKALRRISADCRMVGLPQLIG